MQIHAKLLFLNESPQCSCILYMYNIKSGVSKYFFILNKTFAEKSKTMTCSNLKNKNCRIILT